MKPTILALMRPGDFELLRALYNLNKFDFVLSSPELEEKFLANSMKCESFSKYYSHDVVNKSIRAASSVHAGWMDLLKKPDFQENFSISNKTYFPIIRDELNELFLNESAASILLIEAFKNLYYQKNLCMVLVWTDVINTTKTITYMAKQYGVKVLHISHGGLSIIRIGYSETKIYSDTIAVFGQHLKDQIQFKSGPLEKVVITGDTQKDKFFDGSVSYDKEKLCKELNFDSKSRIVFFGSTWTSYFSIQDFHKNHQEITIKEFFKAFKKLQDDDPALQLAIKLHPTEYGQSKYYERLADEAGIKNYRVFESHLTELLYICDLYTGFRSSIIVNALIFNKPVLLFHFHDISDEEFFKGLAIKWVYKPEDIYGNIKTYLYDEKAIREMQELIPKSVEYFNYKSDGKATQRVLDLVCRMSEETLSAPVREKPFGLEPYKNMQHDSSILNKIDFQGKRVLFIGSLEHLDLQEISARSGEAELFFIERKDRKSDDYQDRKVYYLDFDKDTMDIAGMEKNSFDYIVLKNSLETMYDPWSFLKDLHPYLGETGKVLIEIANIRNLNIFSSIVDGYFTYSDSGIVTFDKLRFFTSTELALHAANAGYTNAGSEYVLDETLGNSPFIKADTGKQYNYQGKNFVLHNIPGGSLSEMHAKNILLTMQKGPGPVNDTSPLKLPKPADYFENPRTDLIEMIDSRPELILEIGCGSGTTCKAIKNQYPGCRTIGIDIDEESIKKASARIDTALHADIDAVELSSLGIEEESLDYMFYGEVLEHLRDPWGVLRRHKKYLKPDGKIIASVPNIRHQSVLLPLLYGRWAYAASGILDATHLRFFTLREIKRLFRSAGLYIYDIRGNPDIKPEDLQIPANQSALTFPLDDLTLQNIPRDEAPEFFIIQFRIKAGKEAADLLKC